MKGNSTWKQTSKIVDMPSMKLNYTIHFHNVSKYGSIKYETGPNPSTRRPHPCSTTDVITH